MRGYMTISDEEKNSILQKHSSFYNGYAVGNVPSGPQPLTVGKGASDPNGITVDNKGNVKTYQNHKINESVISEKKKDDKWIQDVDMDEGDFTEYCNGKVTCRCVEKALKSKGKRKKQAQLYLNMNSDKCKSLQESKLNEIETDDMDVSDEEAAYSFSSGGPEQFDSSYSDDAYGMDIDSIMKMFGDDMSPIEYEDEKDMMDYDLDGREMYDNEEPAYEFDSEGGNVDVFYEEEQCEGCGASEIEEMVPKDLIKGKKYRYKSPSHVDDIEFEDEYGDIDSDPMYQFKGKDTGYSLNPKAIEDFIEDYDEEMMESIKKERENIIEMFNRFKKYN